jgi:hypothetical protein
MKQTAVEWFLENLKNLIKESELTDMRASEFDARERELFEQAKKMEKEQSYSYDEIRTIAYNAYCLGQLDEPTEGKYNLWIQQFKNLEQ